MSLGATSPSVHSDWPAYRLSGSVAGRRSSEAEPLAGPAGAGAAGVGGESGATARGMSRDTLEIVGSRAAEEDEKGDGQAAGAQELTEEEQREVQELKARDAEVRRHEQAHVAAGGQYVSGGPSYSYTRGPDGRSYAVGGEVSIDTSAEDTPEKTIQKMQTVRRAALAPGDPSGQDRGVAASASAVEAQARMELARSSVSGGAEETEQAAGASDSGTAQGEAGTTGGGSSGPGAASELAAYRGAFPYSGQHLDLQA